MQFSRKLMAETFTPKLVVSVVSALGFNAVVIMALLVLSQGSALAQNSASQFRSSLPSAARQPQRTADYSTGSTYQLRARYAVEAQPEGDQGTQLLPVAMNQSEVARSAGTDTAPAPKVARIPIRQKSDKKQATSATEKAKQTNSDSLGPHSSDGLSLSPSMPLSPSVPLPSVSSLPVAPSTTAPSMPSSNVASRSTVDKAWSGTVPPLAEYPSLEQLGNAAIQPQETENTSANTSGSTAANVDSKGSSLPLPNKRPSPQAQQGNVSIPLRSNQSTDKLMSMQSTQIQVGLNGPPSVEVGIPQLYHLMVVNQDQVKLNGLIVRLDIPAGVQVQPQPATLGRAELENVSDGSILVTWSFEGLSPGQQASVPLHLTAQSPTNFEMALEWTFHPVTGSVPVEVRSPQLELALEGPSDVNYGQANTYRLHVSNQGSADAMDVVAKLSAQQFGSSSIQIGQIAAGASETIDVELVFNEAGKIIIAADVTAQGEVAAKAQTQVQVRQAQLELLMEAPELAYHGSPVPYKLVVKNSGDAVASQSKVVVNLPAGAKLDLPPSSTTLEKDTIVWRVPDIRPGASAELTFQLSLTREGENQLLAHCSTSAGKAAQTSIATLVKAVTDLKLVVTDPAAPATVGAQVQYELTLLNQGSKAVEQVSVAAMFSRGIEPKSAEGHRHEVMPGQVRFEPIARMEPGETITLRVVAEAQAAGMHRFRAEVNTADAEVKLVQEESTEFLESIRRTATVNSGRAVVR